ncbi:kinase-like domain-containing protein [Pilobolus umbonatus]|nr:kinase-like domain-containing protein [Pilobolus umbonatus]
MLDLSAPVTPDDQEPIKHPSLLISTLTSIPQLFDNDISNEKIFCRKTSVVPHNSTSCRSTRYLPQNQAIITTHDNWRISLLNETAVSILSGSRINQANDYMGTHILEYIDTSFRSILLEKIVKRREDDGATRFPSKGNILIGGDMVPIVKQDQSKSTVYLWLKEKKDENGSSIFIWILEELYQSTNDAITYAEDGVYGLFGYSSTELIHKHINTTIIPKYDSSSKQFGCSTKLGAHFPVMARMQETTDYNILRITSIPTLAGLVTVKRNSNTIENCDVAFTKHLFGFSGNDLTNKNISLLLPQFPALISCIERDDLLQHGCILNNLICRKILASIPDTSFSSIHHSYYSHPPTNSLPQMIAVHRDGTPFEIDLQIKLLEGAQDHYGLWLSYDRDAVLSRYGHHNVASPTNVELETTISRSKSINIPTSPIQQRPSIRNEEYPTNIRSFSRPAFSTISSSDDSLTSEEKTPSWPRMGEYSAQTLRYNINDYEIIRNLGEGAYGFVKLAHLKTDPEKKEVVIKYVIKSRILVDCWKRDRKLGLVPAEIHVLHTLRKIPHINCSEMLDYFEDDDYYYIVTSFYGDSMDLFDYIELNDHMKEYEIKSIFRQIISGVAHLHDHGIVHRDIKDENVILDSNGLVRLIDFGSAAYVKPNRKFETFAGTLDYAAPEVLNNLSYTGPPQDVWACGTLLYTLIYRENPFYNYEEIMKRELRLPYILSEESVDLIRGTLERDITKRLTIQQILNHPWLST